MSKPKTKRNRQIFLDKMGYEKITDTEPSKERLSYTDLILKYKLSSTTLQKIIKRWKEKAHETRE